MHAVTHTLQADGTVVATCDHFPKSAWSLTSGSFDESRERAEEALRRHINETLSFAHCYDVREEAAA